MPENPGDFSGFSARFEVPVNRLVVGSSPTCRVFSLPRPSLLVGVRGRQILGIYSGFRTATIRCTLADDSCPSNRQVDMWFSRPFPLLPRRPGHSRPDNGGQHSCGVCK